jgi:hypothetical protein
MTEETRNIKYRVLSLGMDLKSPSPRGKEQHLNTGDVISRADLLLFTRQKYIDGWVRQGDLEIVTEESNADIPTG